MSNDKENTREPRRHGPPGAGKAVEKPKNFRVAIKRLFHELNAFKVLIFISLFLATAASILAIFTPNILSDLTDEISKGLVVNSKNLETVTKSITENVTSDKAMKNIQEILSIDLSEDNIRKILTSTEISQEDKVTFNSFLLKVKEDPTNALTELSSLPVNILKSILKDTTYKNTKITVEDKIALLDFLANKDAELSTNLSKILLPEVKVLNKTISSKDQIEFLTIFKSLDIKDKKDVYVNKLYKKIDELPASIKTLVEPKMDLEKIKNITVLLASLYIISALFNYFESIAMTEAANRFAQKLRTSISTKINKLPLKYFDAHSTGDILSRITNDIDTIAQSMNESLSTLVSATALLLGTIIMMFVTNWILAITAILSSLFGFIFMFLVLGKSQKYFTERQVELGNLNGHIEEVYSGINVVKVYNGTEEANKKFDELNKKLYNANRKSQFLSGLMPSMMQFIGNFGYVAVCIVGALLTMNGNITFGVIVAFITYVRLFSSPLSQLAQATARLQSTAAASERVYEFLDEKEMSNQKEITKVLGKEQAAGKIEFKNVVFKYDGNEKPTIKNFTASAKPGQKIAIVGPTGAGKTTLVNLLMKFYEINSGNIIIDGTSINDLSRENIHTLFTMVLQDTWLFNGTIKENIVYNQQNISDDKIKEVCKTIGLDHFIKTLPEGYNTELSDNESISAGQKQLLTIARGMIEDAPFLILDEATSNVDTRTEELVQKAMDKLMQGRTSFIIAHRLSTIKNADLILVMNQGDIIEQGNHEELLKKNGFYANLYNSQFDQNIN